MARVQCSQRNVRPVFSRIVSTLPPAWASHPGGPNVKFRLGRPHCLRNGQRERSHSRLRAKRASSELKTGFTAVGTRLDLAGAVNCSRYLIPALLALGGCVGCAMSGAKVESWVLTTAASAPTPLARDGWAASPNGLAPTSTGSPPRSRVGRRASEGLTDPPPPRGVCLAAFLRLDVMKRKG